jgi:ribosomal protein S27E
LDRYYLFAGGWWCRPAARKPDRRWEESTMKCPGQDMQFWKPGDIYEVDCPGCGRTVEFFKDDTARRCGHCGHRFANPKMDFGCAAYCPYAEQCIGDLPPEVAAQQENLLKDKVAVAVKQYFGRDFRRIGHATRVARYAEQMAKAENASLAVVLTAAYLLEVDQVATGAQQTGQTGDQEAVRTVPVARAILDRVHARGELADVVCDLIAHLHENGASPSLELCVVRDAVLLAGLEEQKRDGTLDADDLQKARAACCTAACQQQANALMAG